MRFHPGKFPRAPGFVPDSSWQTFEDRERSIWAWQLRALPFAAVNMAIIGMLWLLLTPVKELVSTTHFPLPIAGFLLCLVGVLIVHELVHAAVHPMAGISKHTIIGFWPSRMLLYVVYDGELRRNRLAAILLMPAIVISLLPVLVAAMAQSLNVWVIYITLVNAFLASGDMWAAWVILQLPRGAVVRSDGEDAYWRVGLS